MKYKVVVRLLAEKDLQKSFDWYEFQQKNLGKDFLDEISKGIKIIQSNPYIYQVKYKEIRVAYIKKFPFGIHYLIMQNQIVILGVFHFKLNNKRWKIRK